jgi:hypothetical protein
LGIVVEKQIPRIIATLLQNYLLNNFVQQQSISNFCPKAEIAGYNSMGGLGGEARFPPSYFVVKM